MASIPVPEQPGEDKQPVLADLPGATGEVDISFSGTAVMVVMPLGSDADLVQRVRQGLGHALPANDDPPIVVLFGDDLDLEEPNQGAEGRREFLPVILIPIAVKVAKEGIDYLAKEAAHQQKMEHEAQRAHMKSVDAELKRQEAWRKKTFG